MLPCPLRRCDPGAANGPAHGGLSTVLLLPAGLLWRMHSAEGYGRDCAPWFSSGIYIVAVVATDNAPLASSVG